jgi:5-hydroxyisourate hydrolase-like protein (transthyretin family)
MTMFFVLICFIVGCSNSRLPNLHQVKGKITHQGKPLEGVTVNFFPVAENSQARSATGQTATDGTFALTTLHTNDGIFAGDYKITLRKLLFSMTSEEINDIEKNGHTARIDSKNIIPAQYQKPEATPLTFTVKAGKNISCDIDIPEELQKAVFPAWSKYEAQKKK